MADQQQQQTKRFEVATNTAAPGCGSGSRGRGRAGGWRRQDTRAAAGSSGGSQADAHLAVIGHVHALGQRHIQHSLVLGHLQLVCGALLGGERRERLRFAGRKGSGCPPAPARQKQQPP